MNSIEAQKSILILYIYKYSMLRIMQIILKETLWKFLSF